MHFYQEIKRHTYSMFKNYLVIFGKFILSFIEILVKRYIIALFSG